MPMPFSAIEDVYKRQIKSLPWKYLFTGFFIVIGIYMGLGEPMYAVAALLSCWLLLLMSIADIKYRIVPVSYTHLLHNINKKTLMWYDRVGILKPAVIKENGYRYYTYFQSPVPVSYTHLDVYKRQGQL